MKQMPQNIPLVLSVVLADPQLNVKIKRIKKKEIELRDDLNFLYF